MKKVSLIVVPLVVFFVLLTFSITCPNRTAHVKAIEADINENLASGEAKDSIDSISRKKILKVTEFSNYILFSKSECCDSDSSFAVSYGVLGKVYTKSLDKMRSLIEAE